MYDSSDYDYPAGLFDAVHSGNPGDIEFYQKACADAASILELGCGCGRIGLALARPEVEIYGLDLNRDALTVASARGLQCVAADMRNFRLSRTFERIIIPYNGLYCLLSDADIVACLGSARRHLARGGQIIFDGYVAANFADEHTAAPLSAAPQLVAEVEFDECEWDVYEETVMWPATRRVDATYIHVPRDGRDEVRATIRQRYLRAQDVPGLLGAAGLTLASLQGDFFGGPVSANAEHLVVRAEIW